MRSAQSLRCHGLQRRAVSPGGGLVLALFGDGTARVESFESRHWAVSIRIRFSGQLRSAPTPAGCLLLLRPLWLHTADCTRHQRLYAGAAERFATVRGPRTGAI